MKDYWSKLKLNESWGKKERFNYIMNYIDEVIGGSDDEGGDEGDNTGKVTVTVTDKATGDVVSNADVSIYDKGEPYEGTTGSNGKCTISNIPYGTYTIEAVAEGFDFTVESITIDKAAMDYGMELTVEA